MTRPRDLPERVLCAAIWVDDGKPHVHQPTETGFVVCGHRHHNVINVLAAMFGLKFDRNVLRLEETQGFLTTKGRFLDRKAALDLAVEMGQVIRDECHMPHIGLDTSDLY